jgi:hypothetical protein
LKLLLLLICELPVATNVAVTDQDGTVQLVRDGLSEHDIWQGLQAFQVRNHESFMYQGLTALSRFKQTVPG